MTASHHSTRHLQLNSSATFSVLVSCHWRSGRETPRLCCKMRRIPVLCHGTCNFSPLREHPFIDLGMGYLSTAAESTEDTFLAYHGDFVALTLRVGALYISSLVTQPLHRPVMCILIHSSRRLCSEMILRRERVTGLQTADSVFGHRTEQEVFRNAHCSMHKSHF